MSKAINSPTARMLRSSRLFSMPPPLPQPSMELHVQQTGQIRVSDTATLPYPTKQTITAPASSRHRGDWGFKRPLPEKTNHTSTPYVRLNAMDTLEHITDFDSAADHTQNRKRWQEMNIRMTEAPTSTNISGKVDEDHMPASAFHSTTDNTVLPRDRQRGQGNVSPINSLPLGVERALRVRDLRTRGTASSEQQRWRFLGPQLSSMQEAEFDRYVERIVEIPEMRAQFREFLLHVLKEEKRSETMQKLRKEEGFDPNRLEDVQQLDAAVEMHNPQAEVDKYMLALRDQDSTLIGPLSRLIGEFFDLPPFPVLSLPRVQQATTAKAIAPGRKIPPVHPSAGLSYIKSAAFMQNDPVHGPQWEPSPIEARVLRPRESSFTSYQYALLGVGGFAIRDPTGKGTIHYPQPGEPAAQGQAWDFEQPGCRKVWVKPAYGFVDDVGKVHMQVEYSEKEAVAVKTGQPDIRSRASNETDDQAKLRIKSQSHATGMGQQEAREFRNVLSNTENKQAPAQSLLQALAIGKQRRKGGL